MATIITTPFSVLNAKNFVDIHNSSPSISNYLYVGIGRSTAWVDDTLPPSPIDSPDEISNFWTDLIGVQKIATTDISLAIPRVNWTSGVEYDTFDPTVSTAYDGNFYVVNSEFRVYTVATKSGGAPTAVTEPLGSNSGTPINTGDGYTWQYLYDISLQDIQNLVNSDWVPVNWGDSQSAEQAADGDVNAFKTLGAKNVLLKAKLEDTGLPTGITYRQIAIIADPLDSGSSPATALIILKAGLTNESGNTIHIENRTPVTRNPGQSEDVKLIVQF